MDAATAADFDELLELSADELGGEVLDDPSSPDGFDLAGLAKAGLAFAGEHSLAATTRRGYEGSQRRWTAWLSERGLAAEDAQPLHVIQYIAYLAEPTQGRGYGVGTIHAELCGIKSQYQASRGRFASPVHHEAVANAMAKLREKYGVPPVKATPMLYDDLLAAVSAALELGKVKAPTHNHKPAAVRLYQAALFVVSWHAALRGDELRRLHADWVTIAPDFSGATITIDRSKTDQFRKGQTVAVFADENAEVCPVLALIMLTAASSNGHLACVADLGNARWGEMSRTTSLTAFDDFASAAFGTDHDYSVYSLRRGMATQLRQDGAPISHISRLLRHSSHSTTMGYFGEIGAAKVSTAVAAASLAVAA